MQIHTAETALRDSDSSSVLLKSQNFISFNNPAFRFSPATSDADWIHPSAHTILFVKFENHNM